MWVSKDILVSKMLNSFLSDSASPTNPLWFRNSGFMSGIAMALQVISGSLLSLYHSDMTNYASHSVVYLSMEVEMGFTPRSVHPGGASLLSMPIYIHLGRSLWHSSYSMKYVWMIGVVILLVLMMVSFSGYVLPRGQMSFWAATVITNLLYAVPYTGGALVERVWGGLSVGGPTLSRFFTLHHTLPFSVLVLSVVHLGLLHTNGSSNPSGVLTNLDKAELHWFHTLKDTVPFVVVGSGFAFMTLSLPYIPMDAENPPFADSLKTPEHIKPEWYFSFAHRIPRSVPNKAGGVIGSVTSIGVLSLIPYVKSSLVKIQTYYDKFIVVMLMMVFIMLTRLGGCSVEWPHDSPGKAMSLAYLASMFC